MKYKVFIVLMILSAAAVCDTAAADVLVWQKPKRPPEWWINFADWQIENALSDGYRWLIGCSEKRTSITTARQEAYTRTLNEIGNQLNGKLEETDSYFRCYGENRQANATSFEVFILYKVPPTPEDIYKQRYEELVNKGRTFTKNGKLLEAQIFFQEAKQLDPQRPIPELEIVTRRIQKFEELVKSAEEPELPLKIAIERYESAKKYVEQERFDVPEWISDCDRKIFEKEHGNRYFTWLVAFHEIGPRRENGPSLVGSEICDRLTENGIRLVFSADCNPDKMSETELINLARERNADILLIGDSSAKKSTDRPGDTWGVPDFKIMVCHATASIRVIRVEDGYIELTKTVYTKGFDDNLWEEAGENALKEAGKAIGKTIYEGIIHKKMAWLDTTSSEHHATQEKFDGAVTK